MTERLLICHAAHLGEDLITDSDASLTQPSGMQHRITIQEVTKPGEWFTKAHADLWRRLHEDVYSFSPLVLDPAPASRNRLIFQN
jgi:hypothetical protein